MRWSDADGFWYYAQNGAILKNTVAKINGKYYGFDAQGRMYENTTFEVKDFYGNLITYHASKGGVLLTSQLVAVQFRGKKVLTVILCILYVAGAVMSGSMRMNDLGLTILLVLVSHFSLKFAEKYNYEWVKTSEVKSGMILSCFAVQQFLCSRVKGLPESTDETTKSRITQEQAESIHRWEKSQYGKEYIMVVRYIPFAVFILAGLITYLVGVVIIK